MLTGEKEGGKGVIKDQKKEQRKTGGDQKELDKHRKMRK